MSVPLNGASAFHRDNAPVTHPAAVKMNLDDLLVGAVFHVVKDYKRAVYLLNAYIFVDHIDYSPE